MGTRQYATDGSSPSTLNPFENAKNLAYDARNFVSTQFGYVKGILGTVEGDALADVNTAIDALAAFDFTLPDAVLERPDVNWNVDVAFDLPPVNATNFGTISDFSIDGAPEIGTLPSISGVNIPGFTPSISNLNIPDPPDPGIFLEPGDPPPNPGFEYPDEVEVEMPDKYVLLPIQVPNQPEIIIPDLELVEFPILEPMSIDTYINWSEPVYEPEIWADVKAQILTFFAGGTGMRPEVEDAIVSRGRDREDRLVRQTEMQATEEWAARGYTAPPGMLTKRIDNIREEGLVKKLGHQREVTIKAMEEELTNVRLAVQQGIVAERMFVDIHLAAVERLFMIERLHVEWEIQKYNLLVTAYQAKLTENQIRASVYEVQVRAALVDLEIFKALIEAENLKSEVNKTLIEAYKAEIEAREAIVSMYAEQVRAVGIQASVYGTEVDAYKATIEAFATRVGADKLKFDAYDSQIRGEVGKANIVEAEARAYQAEIGGIEVGVRAETAELEGYVTGFRAEVDAYEAVLRGSVAKNQAELAALQGNVAGYQADTQRFVAAAGVNEAVARVNLAAWDAEARMTLGFFDAQVKELELNINKILGQKNLLLDAIQSQGQLASTVVAGGLAAMHAGATFNGSGSVNAAGSDGVSFTYSDSQAKSCATSTSANINYESDTEPSLSCDI